MSVLRKNILLVAIKPHSTLKKYFNGSNLVVDLYCYADVIDYIRSMHTSFTTYAHAQANSGIQETFTILDKNLRELSGEELYMRRPHKGDVLHIVPAIVGGGGKRGAGALIAAAALVFFLPAILASAGVAGVAGAAGATLGTAAAVGNIGILGSTLGALSGTIGLNLALMGVSMLLAPKTPKTETSRDNNAFGSLVNTTNSGIPVALHYGLDRVAGQLISGYTKTIRKADGDDVGLSDIVNTYA